MTNNICKFNEQDHDLDTMPSNIDPRHKYFHGDKFVPFRLAKAIKREGKYAYGYDQENGNGRLMTYTAGLWRPAIDIPIKIQHLLKEEVKQNRVRETIAALEREVDRVPWNKWNTNRQLINCLSGMIDPVTLDIKEHSPEYYSTIQIPVSWNSQSKCSYVDVYLRQIVPRDCIELVFMMLGYFLIPDVSSKAFFVLIGPTDTGKTTFLSLIKELVGERNFVYVSIRDLTESRFGQARLENKLVTAVDDITSQPLQDVSLMKMLTGGSGVLLVERKGKDAYASPLYARLIFTGNEMPNSSDRGEAWYKRLYIIPFGYTIPGKDKDPNLLQKLITPKALEYLFRRSVEGCQKLIKRNMCFPAPPSVVEELKNYQYKNDSVAVFITTRCKLGGKHRVERTQWYQCYKDFCEDAKLPCVSSKTAYKQLRNLGSILEKKDGNGNMYFEGITLCPVNVS